MHRIFTMVALALSALAHPIDLNTVYVPEGGDIRGVVAQAPPTMTGGGNLTTLVNHAAASWESAIADNWTIEIKYGWSNSIGGALAQYYGWFMPFGDGRHFMGRILFNPDFPWFADNTPDAGEEYGNYVESHQDLGGGEMNVGKRYTSAGGAAAGRYDLLTAAIHELGHSFSIGIGPLWTSEVSDGDIDVVSPRRRAGSRIPVGNDHLALENSVMYFGQATGERRLLTEVDIEAAMEINEHREYGEPVPEPATIGVLSLGLFALLRRRNVS